MLHKLYKVSIGNTGSGNVFRNEEKHAVMLDKLLCVSHVIGVINFLRAIT